MMATLETSPKFGFHPSRQELYELGKTLRDTCPRSGHATWKPSPHRADPLWLLEQSSARRIPELIPIRYGRMLQSPFTFFRGAALNMAADLAVTPTTGLRVQACGDCHLMNFGAFATPERRVIFDINDLDETLPAPWEWDVKRLATSFILASRNNGHSEDDARDAVLACVRSYREHMAEFSEMRTLDVWYAAIDMEEVLPTIQDDEARKRAQKRLLKARERSVLEHDFPELVHSAALAPTIKENPPLIYHWRELAHEEAMQNVQNSFQRYRETLPEYRRVLLDRFKLMDVAVKVVGVGSVGTWCFVLLLMAAEQDPLFLQVKEARPSVLEAFAGASSHTQHGQRVVIGHQLMQSASDLFLGWAQGESGRQFYVRQLRDMKIKMLVDVFTPSVMRQYAEICGWTLARAHARSGEPAKISGYLGKSDKFDEAIADFASAYADQSERDHELLVRAVREGKLDVFIEED
ncbi:MAG TPA: DUF2252 domain-containing protein [Pirellulales bacterium]|jgi:uncharacterized protein (DUF2252 family)|nr:DUF2252 domain-containing protein [Pirellulales bacterium]